MGGRGGDFPHDQGNNLIVLAQLGSPGEGRDPQSCFICDGERKPLTEPEMVACRSGLPTAPLGVRGHCVLTASPPFSPKSNLGNGALAFARLKEKESCGPAVTLFLCLFYGSNNSLWVSSYNRELCS